MRVFVTGASGSIGSAVVPELIAAGHEVLGLVRSDAAAAAVAAGGGTPLRGDLTDLDSLRAGAAQADGVINLAFSNDWSNIEQGIDEEARAVKTLAAALEGSGRPFVHAGLTPMQPGHTTTEEDPDTTNGPVGGRGHTSDAVLNLAAQGIRSSVVRLPRSVHQRGTTYGFCSVLIAAAQETGVSAYVGDGTQRWPAVNLLDAAQLFRIALEDAAPGTVLHAVADEGDTMRSLAETIGSVLAVPVESAPPERFGVIGRVFALDMPSSSALTRERFDWEPTHPRLIDDLAAGDYPALG
ncbi:SDR family oxidoreductase [Actinacidiphila glaucinigra]|uniref:Nucleoside-diphosphate-sugar epimerase n=1 Tax=Actinacidiphila glaucinigra TaxID=235986 RepID=A0A239MTL8_9ACTN|nr:SDR family oxidoreductase [Actinacidiphila glaucinigra]SNT45593.1 Nucleoside-diphosphate-sugar epimerase [Actinacidiphila glaucinigra]